MATALRCAGDAGAKLGGIVLIPDTFPPKFDLADKWPEDDEDPEARVREMIEAAVPVDPSTSAEGDGFDASARESSTDPGPDPPDCDDNLGNDLAGLGEWDAGEDNAPIPPREWLLGNQFCRTFVSSLLGAGAVGKTALRVLQSLALTTGTALTGEHVFQRSRVLYLLLEDDRDELRRRVRAAMLCHSIAHVAIKGWLFLAVPRGMKLAEMRDGSPQVGELEKRLRKVIVARGIDLVIFDPFIKSHGMPENDNPAIDYVSDLLARLAAEFNIAVDAPHHVRKGLTDPGDADSGRGAGSFKDSGRLVYTVTGMTAQDAERFGVREDERNSYIRVDNAKVNFVPPAAKARWFKLVGVPLGNGTEQYPAGDEIQTVEPWDPPDVWRGISNSIANAILDEIDRGLPDGSRYSDSSAAKERAAWQVIVKHAPDKNEQQARQIIRTLGQERATFPGGIHGPGKARIGQRAEGEQCEKTVVICPNATTSFGRQTGTVCPIDGRRP